MPKRKFSPVTIPRRFGNFSLRKSAKPSGGRSAKPRSKRLKKTALIPTSKKCAARNSGGYIMSTGGRPIGITLDGCG